MTTEARRLFDQIETAMHSFAVDRASETRVGIVLSDLRSLRALLESGNAEPAGLVEARLAWHRRRGLDGSPCPTERECEAFNAGFAAAAPDSAQDGEER